MTGEDVRDEIGQLEARIDALADARERCRKISTAAKLAVTAGTAWIVLTLVTLLPFTPGAFFGALAAAIGGTVLLGSNKTTWDETETALREAEAARAALIGRMELRLVGDAPPTMH
jgi:outer membrane murein-binding lipoprotein Lpp